jgi:hypothetical protein
VGQVIIGECNYGLDAEGNRIPIGLTVEETREFLELTDLLAIHNPEEQLSSINWAGPSEKRWLALMRKHAVELESFLHAGTTKH